MLERFDGGCGRVIAVVVARKLTDYSSLPSISLS
jgi:hypothetical protein